MLDWFKRDEAPALTATDDTHLAELSAAASLAGAFQRVKHLLTPEEVSGVMTKMGDSVGPLVTLCLVNGAADHLELQP